MKEERLLDDEAAARQIGWQMAIEQVMRGLIATHPAKSVLHAWLVANHEQVVSLMLGHAKHDELIASFENTSKRLVGF